MGRSPISCATACTSVSSTTRARAIPASTLRSPRGGEVVGALGWGEGFEEPADLLPKDLDGPLGSPPEERLQFGKGVLDWIEGRDVGPEGEQGCACLFGQRSRGWTLVAR